MICFKQWDMYACLLKKNGAKDMISLQDFADIMMAGHSDEIKAKINEQIKTVKPECKSMRVYKYLFENKWKYHLNSYFIPSTSKLDQPWDIRKNSGNLLRY